MTDLVFFDCDGVLVDSEIIGTRVSAELLCELGLDITPEGVHKLFGGVSADGEAQILKEVHGLELPDWYEQAHKERLYHLFETELQAIAGIKEVLSNMPVPYCVTSNGTHPRIRKILQVTGLDRYFGRNIFCVDDVAQGKPAPDMFLLAAQTFGVDPKNCLLIDDSPVGITAGRAAGARAIAFLGASHLHHADGSAHLEAGAERTIKRMDEFLQYI